MDVAVDLPGPTPLLWSCVSAKPEWGRCRRIPLSLTVAVLPGLLICLVGFLAWAVPMLRLGRSVNPLANGLHTQVRTMVICSVHNAWDALYLDLWELKRRWDILQQPLDALADAELFGTLVFPVLLYQPTISFSPLITVEGNCTHEFVLMNVSNGWHARRQNCSHQWSEKWDADSQTLTGQTQSIQPAASAAALGLVWPVLDTTSQQPFTWFGIWKPNDVVGNILEANMGLFGDSSSVIGRAGVAMSLGYLRNLVQGALEQGNLTQGGRLALYEPDGLVVASSHGHYDSTRRFNLSSIGDPDLEGAAAWLQRSYHDLCHPTSEAIDLATAYFIDVGIANDTHVSVQHLQWCVLLLTPQVNVLGPVQESQRFAIIFVSATTCVVTLMSAAFGLILTRHIHRLARGLHALRQYDFPAARRACGACTVFRELSAAQLAYDSLVDAMDAFRKYVPEAVVRGLLTHRIQPLLGMVEQDVAVAFMDLDNFMTMCDRLPIGHVIVASAQLFDACSDVIQSHNGVIDKFVGDCIMAMWGAPIPQLAPGRHSAHCIHRLLQFLRDSPMSSPLPGMRLGLRIGLHSGRCLVGNYGASSRWGYTAIGDVVNVASRLESLNKQAGTTCLITDTVYDELDSGEDVRRGVRPMGRVRLIGRQQAVTVYELSDTPQLVPVAWTDALQLFSQGMFRQAAWQLASLSDDVPSCMLLRDMEDAWVQDAEGDCVRLMRAK